MNNKDSGKDVVIGCLLMLVALPFTVLLRAFVLSQLWTWFLTPFGLPTIGLPWAYGLAATIALFVPDYTRRNDTDGESITTKVIYFLEHEFGRPLLMWVIGFLCYSLM